MNWAPQQSSKGCKCGTADFAQTRKARQSQSWSESEIAQFEDGARKLLHKDLFSTLMK